MDLNLDEQRLLTGFRELDNDGRSEILAAVAQLLKRRRSSAELDSSPAANQCKIEQPAEQRPETKKEPLFTE